MSKIAFISDIHGNYPALDAVLNDIDSRKVDMIVCLGDLVGYYSMINEVIDVIRERKLVSVIGNHDFAMLYNDGVIERSKTCTSVLKRQETYISDTNLNFLSKLPDNVVFKNDIKSFFCIHGGLNDFIDEYLEAPSEKYFETHQFGHDFLATGHTHQFNNDKIGEFRHINPGSVGQPRDNDNRASYMIMDKGVATQVRVSYNIDIIADDMRLKGFEEYIYKGLYTGLKIS